MISRRTGQIVLVNNIQGKLGIPFRTACKLLRQRHFVLGCLSYKTRDVVSSTRHVVTREGASGDETVLLVFLSSLQFPFLSTWHAGDHGSLSPRSSCPHRRSGPALAEHSTIRASRNGRTALAQMPFTRKDALEGQERLQPRKRRWAHITQWQRDGNFGGRRGGE